MVFVTIFNEYQERKHRLFVWKFLMASFDEFMSLVRLLLNLVGKYCKMYLKKLKFSTLLN